MHMLARYNTREHQDASWNGPWSEASLQVADDTPEPEATPTPEPTSRPSPEPVCWWPCLPGPRPMTRPPLGSCSSRAACRSTNRRAKISFAGVRHFTAMSMVFAPPATFPTEVEIRNIKRGNGGGCFRQHLPGRRALPTPACRPASAAQTSSSIAARREPCLTLTFSDGSGCSGRQSVNLDL